MDVWLRISAAVLGIIIAVGIIAMLMTYRRRRQATAQQPNYRVFFIIGTVMLVVGIAETFIILQSDMSFVIALPLILIGLVFLVIGLANRDKWQG